MVSSLQSPSPSAEMAITGSPADPSRLERRLFLILGSVALIYAFLAGLQTVGDPDFGWQLARGRWIAQHHQVFTGDVLSYTIPGAPAVYPAGGGLLLYWVYLLGGYKLLSWLTAVTCLATVALLLRRGSAFTAVIAILAMPFIALRMVPRSELFAIVIFAAFVSLLWQHFETSRAPLWLLPLLMLAWVNVHFSFFSGFGLLAAFAGMEVLELPFSGERRRNAVLRLKYEVPWFLATLAATLVNPWVWKIYKETAQYTGAALAIYVNEWAPLHLNWTNPLVSFTLRNTNDIGHILLVIILLAIAAAFFQLRWGSAVLLLAALYEVMHHLRFLALASCIVVIVAGAVLASTVPWIREGIANSRVRRILAAATAAAFVVLAVVRSVDVVSNYHYLAERNLSVFGTGLSGWFPRRAAEFIQSHNLPGEVFNTYNEGGFTLWALGPQRRDYVDGREIPFGAAFLEHAGQLTTLALDSPQWQQEAEKYGINTIIFPLTLDEISLERLRSDCNSEQWRPVYFDEVSIVLVRQRPENRDLIRRFEVSCAIAPVPHDPLPLTRSSFNEWVDAARVLSALRRDGEPLAAIDKAISIFPDNAHARWYRGQILYAADRHGEAEREWQQALALTPREITPWGSLAAFQAQVWSALSELYHRQDRSSEAINALNQVIRLSSDPSAKVEALANLGALYYKTGQSAEAEKQWLSAVSLAPGESAIWFSLGDLYQHQHRVPQAIHSMREATRLSSDQAEKARGLIQLARLYFMSGQPKDALAALDEAAQTAPAELLQENGGRSFSFDLAQGRAAAWLALGDVSKATGFQEEAVKLDPTAADAWSHLAKLYQREGRIADQQRAEEHQKTLTK